MNELRRRLLLLDEADPPDLWEEVGRGEFNRHSREPWRGRILAGVVAFAVVIASSTVLVRSLQDESGTDEKPPKRQESRSEIPDAGVVLDAVPAAYQPRISAEEAVAIAKAQFSDSGEADTIQPTLALFTNLHMEVVPDVRAFNQRPSWVVTLTGMCVPRFGGFRGAWPGSSGDGAPAAACVGTEWNVAVDATTGEMLQAFSYR